MSSFTMLLQKGIEEQMDSNQQSLCKKTFKSPEVGALTLLGYTSLIKMYPFGIPLVGNGTPSFLMQIMDHFLLKKKKKKKRNKKWSEPDVNNS